MSHARWLVVVVCVWALLGTSAQAQTPPYTLVDLGTLGGNYSTPQDINNDSVVVGSARLANNQLHGFAYSNGTMTDLGTLGGTTSGATSINSSGTIVGMARNAANYSRPFIYSGGTMTDMCPWQDQNSNAQYIGDSGLVVLSMTTPPNGDRYPFTYLSGTLTNLYSTFGLNQYALPGGANASGEQIWTVNSVATLFKNGAAYTIPTLGGSQSIPTHINILGQICGYSFLSGNNYWHAFLWRPSIPYATSGSSKDLGTLGGNNSYAHGLNAWGEVVGKSEVTPGSYVVHAFLMKCCTMVDLNNLIAPGSGWTLECATAINDRSQIVGYGTAPNGQTRAFLLNPN